MRLRRLAAGAALTAIAAGGAVLATTTIGAAATAPPPTPISLNLTGMASSACPLPLNGSMAVAPGVTVQFTPDALLNALSSESLTITPAPNSTDPKSSTTISSLTATNGKISFTRPASYALSWKTTPVPWLGIVSAAQKGTLVVNSAAQKCVVAVQVPTPAVSIPVVPSAVNSVVNGVVGTVVGGANGALGPVNKAVGPVLGSANSGLGNLSGGSSKGGGTASSPAPQPTIGTVYKPTGPTVAQRTVPQGYGNGSGLGGTDVSANGNSITAPAIGFVGTGKSATKTGTAVKSGGSPKTVDLAANKPSSAFGPWSNLIVVAAVIALSAATAMYARTYLMHPLPKKVTASK